MDFRKIVDASKLIIGFGIALVILSFVLSVVLTIVLSSFLKEIGVVIVILNMVIVALLFLGLYFWAGMRAVKNYGLDPIGAGVVAAFSYLMVAAVHFVIDLILRLILSGWIAGIGLGGEYASEFLAIGGLIGLMNITISVLWTVLAVPLGVVINLFVGILGGWYAER